MSKMLREYKSHDGSKTITSRRNNEAERYKTSGKQEIVVRVYPGTVLAQVVLAAGFCLNCLIRRGVY